MPASAERTSWDGMSFLRELWEYGRYGSHVKERETAGMTVSRLDA